MGRKAKELSALGVKNLTAPGYHAVGGVDGLYLQVSASGSRSWILRVKVGNSRPEYGLGAYPELGLATAREKGAQWRELIRAGKDPRELRRAAKAELLAEQATNITFEEFARKYIEEHEDEWSERSRKQWLSSLEKHVFPKIGGTYLRHIERKDVLEVLEPIWREITETATRVRGRIEAILAAAIVKDLRPAQNPATWGNYLDKVLPAPEKIMTEEHHPALPLARLNEFMIELGKREGPGARCLEFLILTAARSGEARGATWSEIDFDHGVWVIPKERMKGKREHRVPLSERAIHLLRQQPRLTDCELIFPSPQKGVMLSDATLAAVMKRMGVTDAVPHGFRSCFKDWATELTDYPNDMSELALAHTVGSKVEQAYRRLDMFEKRRQMMDHWAAFTARKWVAPNKARVLKLTRKAA